MPTDRKRDFSGLMKIAFPGQTVGDFMHSWNANLGANTADRRDAFDRINRAGIDVKQPASRLPYVLGGSMAGKAVASYLGANSFWKGVASLGGAMYGRRLYDRQHPNPMNMPYAPGVVKRGF